MLTRRRLLTHTLRGSSLVALGTVVPHFVERAARGAAPGKDNVLVVLELTGGNDGLNTVIPYADDLYHKARPTLRQTRDAVVRLDDHVGLNSGMQGFRPLWDQGQLAVVHEVDYRTPSSRRRGHGHLAVGRPTGMVKTGWLGGPRPGRPVGRRADLHLAARANCRSPLNRASGGGAISVGDENSFRLELGGGKDAQQQARRRLLGELAAPTGHAGADDLASFVRRRQVQTLTAVETLRELLEGPGAVARRGGGLSERLQLVAGLIARGTGTRIFYVSLEGFDTHANQGPAHGNLLGDLANSVTQFFQTLKTTGHDGRVRLLTFSEFGRRVQEERPARHPAMAPASSLFMARPSVKGGVVGSLQAC